MIPRLLLAVALVTAASACKHNKRANTTVRHRAEFDMSCPADELRLIVLDTEGARKLSSLIGVQGCGQQAVYAYFPDVDTWLINGAVTPIEEDFEIPPHATEGKDKKREEKRAAKAEKKGNMTPAEAAVGESKKEKKRRRDD